MLSVSGAGALNLFAIKSQDLPADPERFGVDVALTLTHLS